MQIISDEGSAEAFFKLLGFAAVGLFVLMLVFGLGVFSHKSSGVNLENSRSVGIATSNYSTNAGTGGVIEQSSAPPPAYISIPPQFSPSVNNQADEQRGKNVTNNPIIPAPPVPRDRGMTPPGLPSQIDPPAAAQGTEMGATRKIPDFSDHGRNSR